MPWVSYTSTKFAFCCHKKIISHLQDWVKNCCNKREIVVICHNCWDEKMSERKTVGMENLSFCKIVVVTNCREGVAESSPKRGPPHSLLDPSSDSPKYLLQWVLTVHAHFFIRIFFIRITQAQIPKFYEFLKGNFTKKCVR